MTRRKVTPEENFDRFYKQVETVIDEMIVNEYGAATYDLIGSLKKNVKIHEEALHIIKEDLEKYEEALRIFKEALENSSERIRSERDKYLLLSDDEYMNVKLQEALKHDG